MCLNHIARQVHDLNKYTEYIFGELTKEVDRLYFKLKTVQQSVIQLTDGITQDDPNEGVSLQVRKRGCFKIQLFNHSKYTLPNLLKGTENMIPVYRHHLLLCLLVTAKMVEKV